MRDIPGQVPGAALLNQAQTLARRFCAYLLRRIVTTNSSYCRWAHKCQLTDARAVFAVAAVLRLTRGSLQAFPLHPASTSHAQRCLRRPYEQFSHMTGPFQTADAQCAPRAFTVEKTWPKHKNHMTQQYATHRRYPAEARAYTSKQKQHIAHTHTHTHTHTH